jgi:DNA invertase Pin-like site-specific DNA recombinase
MEVLKFGYARVSGREQNLDLQRDALRNYGIDELYEEKVSGNKEERSQLSEVLRQLRKGDTLVVWKLDRLGRTVKQLLALAEGFEKKGINFVSLTEQFDTSTPMGRYCFTLWCALAQMEREVISERTNAGLKAAKARGRVGGRKPHDPKLVERAIKMYKSNDYSIKDITDSTGISKATLYEYVKKYEMKDIEDL